MRFDGDCVEVRFTKRPFLWRAFRPNYQTCSFWIQIRIVRGEPHVYTDLACIAVRVNSSLVFFVILICPSLFFMEREDRKRAQTNDKQIFEMIISFALRIPESVVCSSEFQGKPVAFLKQFGAPALQPQNHHPKSHQHSPKIIIIIIITRTHTHTHTDRHIPF
jgi:hypothetical protein